MHDTPLYVVKQLAQAQAEQEPSFCASQPASALRTHQDETYLSATFLGQHVLHVHPVR